jgi:hypothetical protein
MTWTCRAVWYGYPCEAEIRAWTPTFDPDDAHPVAEGIRP